MPRSLAMASRLDTAPFPPVKAMSGSVCVWGEVTCDYLGELAGGRGGGPTLLPGGKGGRRPREIFQAVLGGWLFRPPVWHKNLRIRPWVYFFMVRSILMLLDLEIPLKTKKITKNRIYK